MAIRGMVLPVGPPVTLEWQIGRAQDIEQVRFAAENGEDIVVVDVRKTGKTTVVLCALELLANAGQMVFPLDATENSPTSVDLAERLATQLATYLEPGDKGHQAVRDSVRLLHAVGAGATSFIENDRRREAAERLLEALRATAPSGAVQLGRVFDEIGKEARRRRCRAVVSIDEIQAIAAWEDTAELQNVLRTRLKARESIPSFVFAGSKPTAIETLFRRDGVFGFHGITHRLAPIKPADWHAGLTRAFGELGCEIPEDAIDELLLETDGHPQRTMLLARETHRIVHTSDTPKRVSRGHVVAAAEDARKQHLWQIDPSS